MTDLFLPPPAAALRRPVAVVDAAGDALDAVTLSVHLGLAPEVDAATVTVPSAGGLPQPGAPLTVALGFADGASEPVLTGTVARVQRGSAGTATLHAVDGGALLAHLRVAASFEQQRVSDVVRDLCGRVGASPAALADGETHPFLALDAAQGAWRQLAVLAAYDGHVLAVDGRGRVVLGPPGGEVVLRAAEGADAAEVDVVRAEAADAPTLVGEGAAGTHGSDAWAWLLADPTAVRAGGPGAVRSAPALRSRAAVEVAARAQGDRVAAAALVLHVVVPLTTAVRPGAALEVTTTDGVVTGNALAVRHHLRHGRPATTTVVVRGGPR